jgi:hypothetical protein
VEIHLEIAHHLKLALLQAAFRPVRLESTDEGGLSKLQLMEHEGRIDRLAVDIPPGCNVGLVELYKQFEEPSQTQEFQG